VLLSTSLNNVFSLFCEFIMSLYDVETRHALSLPDLGIRA
jgi:hypothetical protein